MKVPAHSSSEGSLDCNLGQILNRNQKQLWPSVAFNFVLHLTWLLMWTLLCFSMGDIFEEIGETSKAVDFGGKTVYIFLKWEGTSNMLPIHAWKNDQGMRLDATGSNIWEVFNTDSETLYSAEVSLVVIQQWISPAMKKKKKIWAIWYVHNVPLKRFYFALFLLHKIIIKL